MKKISKTNGYTLIEAIIYAFLFVLILVAIIEALLVVTKSGRNVKVVKDVESSAYSSMDRMSREIRNGIAIRITGSVFGTSTGALSVDTLDQFNNLTTIKFYLSNGAVLMDKGGSFFGPLTQPGVQVTSLMFNLITSSSSEAVKIEMTVQSNTQNLNISKKFYTTSVVNGSYQ